MAFTSIKLDVQTFNELDLGVPTLPLDPPLHLKGLDKVVLLAGANGAGKTRLLRMLPCLLNVHSDAKKRQDRLDELSIYEQNFTTWKEECARLESEAALPAGEAVTDDYELAQRKLAEVKQKRDQLQRHIESARINLLPDDRAPDIVWFVPQKAELFDPAAMADMDVSTHVLSLSRLGNEGAERGAIAYLREKMRGALRARDPARATKLKPDEMAKAIRDEASLQQLLCSLIGAENRIDIDESLNVVINDTRLGQVALSQGQQLLFQFGCMLHAQEKDLRHCIVLLDEPENHLHPSVVNQVVDHICRVAGQVWIATHSVPLIAHLVAMDADCLWLVEQGKISRAGRNPGRVLERLMGGPDGSKNLHDFTRMPAEYAALGFLAQCLREPGVVGADIKDPQTNQIAKLVCGGAGSSKRIRILDFGAGKARLLPTILALWPDAAQWLDYFAVDSDPTTLADRQREIEVLYPGEAVARCFVDASEAASHLDFGSVDAVVMCNVLHEVEPGCWTDLFGRNGRLTTLLAKKGVLLVVEDYGIPVGERAHRYGFLLLDGPELKQLFNISEGDYKNGGFLRQASVEPKYSDRLIAYAISKKCVAKMTANTRKKSIEALRRRMEEQVKAYLENSGQASADAGRSYALKAQLLTNAYIWCKEHGS